VVAATVLIVAAGVAYANNSAAEPTSTGDRGARVAGNEGRSQAWLGRPLPPVATFCCRSAEATLLGRGSAR
jgi:hypothetical protein